MYWTQLQYSRHTGTHGNDFNAICSRLREVQGRSLAGKNTHSHRNRHKQNSWLGTEGSGFYWDSGEVGWARSGKVGNRKSVQKVVLLVLHVREAKKNVAVNLWTVLILRHSE